MKQTKRKLCSIVGELTTFFFQVGSREFTIHTAQTEEGYQITASCRFDPACLPQVERMVQLLHAERNAGIEEAYWELAGLMADGGSGSEAVLLGQMADRLETTVEGDRFSICLLKRP
ncbi:MAG TPA: hypothetical protein H9680_00110 [Firmicutes bacterium]|nr:hypothetical protein [Bacillota bacterium]